MKVISKILVVAVIMTSGFLLVACDNTFEPFHDGGQYAFSVFGPLDLSADTQWVRVMPVRGSLFLSPESRMNASVNLTRNSTGETVAFRDSMFSYFHYFDTDSTVYAWNFWSDYKLHEGETYSLEITDNSTGRSSSATVTIPSDFPTPYVSEFSQSDWSGTIWCPGVERIVVAEIKYYYRPEFTTQGVIGAPTTSTVSQIERDRVQPIQGGGYRINVSDKGYLSALFAPAPVRVHIDSAEVLIVSGEQNWPEYQRLAEQEQALPEEVSNVENGLGLLVGIVSKRIPYKSCYDDNGDVTACDLEKADTRSFLLPENHIRKNRIDIKL